MDKVFGRRRRKGQKRQTTQRQPANPPARQGMIRLCFFSRIFLLSLFPYRDFSSRFNGVKGDGCVEKKLVSIYPRTDWWRTWPRLIRPSMLLSLSFFSFSFLPLALKRCSTRISKGFWPRYRRFFNFIGAITRR